MRFKKTLSSIVIAGAIGLSGCFCTSTESPRKRETAAQVQPSQEKNSVISGRVEDVDKDSFDIHVDCEDRVEFQFETLRVKSPEGKVYRLIHRGPSSYRIGDEINFSVELLPSRRISYEDVTSRSWCYVQEGSIEADGIIR